MPPWPEIEPSERTSQIQFCFWLTTIRFPVPVPVGTGRLLHATASGFTSLARVISVSLPLCERLFAAWNRMIAARVWSFAVPVIPPASQPNLFSRYCACCSDVAALAGARAEVVSAKAARTDRHPRTARRMVIPLIGGARQQRTREAPGPAAEFATGPGVGHWSVPGEARQLNG